jgi:hypothetical protein
MNGYFKQVTPPKAPSNLESKEHSLNEISKFKKNGCKMFVIEYDPIDNNKWHWCGHCSWTQERWSIS